MNKTFAVIRRELVARVRTRAFVIATLILPIFMVFVAVVPALMMRGGNRTMQVALVDGTGDSLGSRIESALAGERLGRDPGAPARYTVRRFVGTGRAAALRDSLVALTGVSRDQHPVSFDGVLVVTDSTIAAQNLDQMLWSFSQESFVPHRIITRPGQEPPLEPVVIVSSSMFLPGFQVVVASPARERSLARSSSLCEFQS